MNLYDMLLAQKLGGGGSTPSVTVEEKNITQNGTYSEEGKAYSPVNVLVPNSYSAGDEGKVVSNGALVAQSSQNIDTNGTYDTTLKDEIVVNVSGGGGGDTLNKLIDRSITSITIPSGVTSIGDYAFRGCSALTSITIPNGVTSIEDYAFTGLSSLTSISIPSGVTRIGNYSFQSCSVISSIALPNSVTYIGNYAFNGCKGLTAFTIPSSVTNIGNNAFTGCTKITTVTCEATTPPTLGGTSVFDSNKVTTIYVPAASVDTYKAADKWSAYASKIQAIPS